MSLHLSLCPSPYKQTNGQTRILYIDWKLKKQSGLLKKRQLTLRNYGVICRFAGATYNYNLFGHRLGKVPRWPPLYTGMWLRCWFWFGAILDHFFQYHPCCLIMMTISGVCDVVALAPQHSSAPCSPAHTQLIHICQACHSEMLSNPPFILPYPSWLLSSFPSPPPYTSCTLLLSPYNILKLEATILSLATKPYETDTGGNS